MKINLGGILGGITKAISVLPVAIAGVESIFGAKTGAQKKEAVLNTFESGINIAEYIANKEILDEALFREGLDQIVEGQLKIQKAVRGGGVPK